jgi:hypothetical protein
MGCEHAYDDGPYVLGALSPVDRAAYERHLPTCDSCREAVSEIAVLPGLLGRLDEAGLERITAPSSTPTFEHRSSALVSAARAVRHREKRINRIRYAGAALVAACLALIVGLGVTLLEEPANPGTSVAMSEMRTVANTNARDAKIGINSTKWGTEVTMWCTYENTSDEPRKVTYRLVAISKDGATREQVMSWMAGPGDELTFTAPTRFTQAELGRFEIISYEGTTLLTFEIP